VRFRPLTEADADELLAWRYPGEYATYDHGDRAEMLAGGGPYFVADEDGAIVAYCCFGAPARVPPMEEVDGVLDVGWGLRPDLMGQRRGPALIEAVLDLARERYAPRRFRIAVYAWNERAQRAPAAAGFRHDGPLEPGGEFLLMSRDS
jgi:RimJ/RimL family protein N-acetyltransferase